MGILTGALLAGIFGKYFSSWKKSKNLPFQSSDPAALVNAKKIVIIGCSGSGKTYCAFALAKKLHLPIIYLDQYTLKADWKRVPFDDLKIMHHELCTKPVWIMDGAYPKLLEECIDAADAIIFLDIARSVCLWNVIQRAIFDYGKVGEGDPAGCIQKPLSFKTLDFLRWILNFNRNYRKNIITLLEKNKETKLVYSIRLQADIHRFIESIENI